MDANPIVRSIPAPDPLDALLRQLAEQAPSARARAWAGRLIERGEAAAGSTSTPLPKLPPHCGCGAIARPGVVWFGEPLGEVWADAEHAARTAELLLVVGTSAVVYPAANLAQIAKSAGARVIEINPEETTLSGSVDLSLRGRAGELLPRLIDGELSFPAKSP